MATVNLKNMDVDALLTLRGDVERMLAERGRDLQRQVARLGGGGEIKRRGRPPGGAGRASVMKGVKVPPKYAGPAARRGRAGARHRAMARGAYQRGSFDRGVFDRLGPESEVGSRQENGCQEEGHKARTQGAAAQAESGER